MRIRPIIFILLAVVTASCGEYEKLLQSDPFRCDERPPEMEETAAG